MILDYVWTPHGSHQPDTTDARLGVLIRVVSKLQWDGGYLVKAYPLRLGSASLFGITICLSGFNTVVIFFL